MLKKLLPERTPRSPASKRKNAAEQGVPFISFMALFDQQKAEEEERQDQGGCRLISYFFLADKVPEKMKAHVEDDEMIEEPDHDHHYIILSRSGARSNIPIPAPSWRSAGTRQ
jgi:hypothetical protein